MIYLVSDPRATPNRQLRNKRITQYFRENGYEVCEVYYSYLQAMAACLRAQRSDAFIFQVSPRRNVLFGLVFSLRRKAMLECRDPIFDQQTRPRKKLSAVFDVALILLVWLHGLPRLYRKNLTLTSVEKRSLPARGMSSDFGVDVSAMPSGMNQGADPSIVYAGGIYGKKYSAVLNYLSQSETVHIYTGSDTSKLSPKIFVHQPIYSKPVLFEAMAKSSSNLVVNDRGADFLPSKVYEALCLGIPILYATVSPSDRLARFIKSQGIGDVLDISDSEFTWLVRVLAAGAAQNASRVSRVSRKLFDDEKYHTDLLQAVRQL